MRKILVVEDEYLMRDWICGHLRQAFGNATIDEIPTELDFQKKFEEIAADIPDIVIMDMLLAWTSPRRDLEEPPERVRREGIFTAGLRCKELLDQHDKTRSIPVLFYTVLSGDDLSAHLGGQIKGLTYLQKDSNPEVLIDRIRELVDPVPTSELTH